LQKYGRNDTADILDKQLNELRTSKKDLTREVEILEEANRQQAKTILRLRKQLAIFTDQSHSDQNINSLQLGIDEASELNMSSLAGIVPSLSGSLYRKTANSSDDEFGQSTMLTECRPSSKVHLPRDRKDQHSSSTFVSNAIRPETSQGVKACKSPATRSSHSLRSLSRTSNSGTGIRRGIVPPRDSSNHIIWSQPHPEYEEVIRVAQTAKLSETAQAIMQSKQDESGTRLLIRLLSGLHADPHLSA
jgi:hypothetical protein